MLKDLGGKKETNNRDRAGQGIKLREKGRERKGREGKEKEGKVREG